MLIVTHEATTIMFSRSLIYVFGSIIDCSWSCNWQHEVIFQMVALLTDYFRGIIFYQNIFIMHATWARAPQKSLASIFSDDNVVISASVNRSWWGALVHFVQHGSCWKSRQSPENEKAFIVKRFMIHLGAWTNKSVVSDTCK